MIIAPLVIWQKPLFILISRNARRRHHGVSPARKVVERCLQGKAFVYIEVSDNVQHHFVHENGPVTSMLIPSLEVKSPISQKPAH